jgi:RND family efflux transporter MFP subunit
MDSIHPSTSVSQHPPRRAGVRVALVVMLAAFVALSVFTGVRVKQAIAKRDQIAGERAHAQATAIAKPPAVATHPTAIKWRPRVEVTGTLKPWRDADVSFETSGRLARVLVSTGDSVRQSQTLAILDGTRASDIVAVKDAAVRAAAANLALAEDALRRSEALVATRSIPEAQAQQAREQVALMRAQLQAAQADAKLARTGAGQNAIVAPFDGVVTRAPTAAGSVVQPGAPLVHVEDLARLRLSATVGEDDVPLVTIGAAATVTYRDRSVTGKVIAIVPSLDPATRRAPVEIEVVNDPNAPLLAWSFVRAAVQAKSEVDAVQLPKAARRAGSQDEIVIVDGGKARVVRVALAATDDGSWIVRGGVSASDAVLLSPDGDIKDGQLLADVSVQP